MKKGLMWLICSIVFFTTGQISASPIMLKSDSFDIPYPVQEDHPSMGEANAVFRGHPDAISGVGCESRSPFISPQDIVLRTLCGNIQVSNIAGFPDMPERALSSKTFCAHFYVRLPDGSNNDLWYQYNDDMTLAPVPEPATNMLLGIGLVSAGLLGRSRRRRRK